MAKVGKKITMQGREIPVSAAGQGKPTVDSSSTYSGTEVDSNSDSDEENGHSKRDRPIKLRDQAKLNDVVRNLGLAKDAAEYLASSLNKDGLLAKGTKVSSFRNRERDFLPFFKKEECLVYCTNIQELINYLNPNIYQSEEWRLFIDSSIRSLKAVLLHNTNELASIPIAHSVNMPEDYNSLKLVLEKIKYTEHNWKICGNLKILTILLGQQNGFTRHPCFLCLWNSRDREKHYNNFQWRPRISFVPGSANVLNNPLVPPEKVLLPPLHIKLGLMKQFVKALNKEGKAFLYIQEKFPKKSETKLREGVFDGAEIRKLLRDPEFIKAMKDVEKMLGLAL